MDAIINSAKFAISWTNYAVDRGNDIPTSVWVGQKQVTLFAEFAGGASWQNFQKHMGIAMHCCLRTDAEAMTADMLCYRKPETPRTMWMVASLRT